MSARASDIDVAVAAAEPAEPGFLLRAARRVRSDPLGLLGLLLVLLVLFCAAFGPALAPYNPFKIRVSDRYLEPSVLQLFGAADKGQAVLSHVFGTDNLGRDVFSRVLTGTQIALGVGAGSIAIALVIGLVLGLVAGYGPRWIDNLLLLLFDSIYSFPTVMLGLTVMTLLGPSIGVLMLVVVVIQTPAYARLIRTATLSTKSSEYVLAIRSLGGSPGRILLVHILPNIIGPLFIIASIDIPSVIALEAGLTYLGLGIPPPTPSWGRILQEGFDSIRDAPWIVVAGGIPLILTTLGFTFLGEALRDLLDPKLRRIV